MFVFSYRNADDVDKLFLFGGGSRACVGQKLVSNILKVCL